MRSNLTVHALELVVPADPELEQEGATWSDQADALRVASSADLDFAGSLLPLIRARLDQVDALFADSLEKARAAVAAAGDVRTSILAARSKLREPLEQAEKTIKLGMARYIDDQKARERELEQERQRQARAQEEARRVAVQAGLPRPPEPVKAPPAKVEAPAPATGAQVRTVRFAEVLDLAELVRAIAAGTAPLELVEVNAGVLERLAKAFPGESPWAGVRFSERTEIAHEAKRGRRK